MSRESDLWRGSAMFGFSSSGTSMDQALEGVSGGPTAPDCAKFQIKDDQERNRVSIKGKMKEKLRKRGEYLSPRNTGEALCAKISEQLVKPYSKALGNHFSLQRWLQGLVVFWLGGKS